MVSRSRMPPPSWTASLSPTAATMSRITFSFFGRPATAPFRSTTCRRLAPCAAQCLAIATGSSENTVAVAMSPCFRRTQRPSFKSIAGMMSTSVPECESGAPAHEVGQELQAGGLAFFGVELDGEDVIPGHGAGKGRAVDGARRGERGIAGRRIVAVHEVKAAAIRNARPKRVRPLLQHLVPTDMGNLQPGEVEPRHAPRQQAETGGVALVAALEEQLQADADPKKGLRPRRLDHRLARTARAELAHAIGQRTLPGHDDSFRGKNRLRIGGDAHLGLGGDVLERL